MSTSNPVFLIGEEIAFSKRIVRQNEQSYEIDPNQLLTPWGMVIPMNVDSFELLDFFEGGVEEMQLWDRSCRALLVNHKGQVHEMLVAGCRALTNCTETLVSRTRVLTGPQTRYARAHDSEQDFNASVIVSAGLPLRETVEAYNQRFNMCTHDYTYVKIEAIAQRLQELEYTKPFPAYPRPPTPAA